MSVTKIEWADITINPVVGCSKCSPACDNCYAERMAARLAKMPQTAAKYTGVVDENGKWTGHTAITDSMDFSKLYAIRKSKRIFVGSMTDLFHQSVGFDTLRDIFSSMKLCGQHTFMILTKRHNRIRSFCSAYNRQPLPNVWLGVTVCNQAEADEKIPVLLDTPAAKRFVSVEPMLGAVDLGFQRAPTDSDYYGWQGDGPIDYVVTTRVDELHWVICGGETGPRARPMHPDWVRGLRDQCAEAGVPFFFKGWGEWVKVEYEDYPDWQHRDGGRGIFTNLDPVRGQFWDANCAYHPDGHGGMEKIYGTDLMHRISKRRSGRLLDGVEYSEFPT